MSAVFGAVAAKDVPADWEERWKHFHRPVRAGSLWIRPRRRAFEIDPLGRIAAAVAGALEFVFRGLPVRRATQVGALGKNRENASRLADHIYPAPLLVTVTHAEQVVRRRAEIADSAGLKERAREKEAHEHQEVGGEKTPDAGPDNPAAHLPRIRLALGRFLCGNRRRGLWFAGCGRRSGCPRPRS